MLKHLSVCMESINELTSGDSTANAPHAWRRADIS